MQKKIRIVPHTKYNTRVVFHCIVLVINTFVLYIVVLKCWNLILAYQHLLFLQIDVLIYVRNRFKYYTECTIFYVWPRGQLIRGINFNKIGWISVWTVTIAALQLYLPPTNITHRQSVIYQWLLRNRHNKLCVFILSP